MKQFKTMQFYTITNIWNGGRSFQIMSDKTIEDIEKEYPSRLVSKPYMRKVFI